MKTYFSKTLGHNITVPDEEMVGDDTNPELMFSSTATSLLLKAANPRRFDVMHYIKKELAGRGLNEFGVWIGFDKAKELWLDD